MMLSFAQKFFWKSLRDFRAWIGVVGLVLAAIGGASGRPIILPTWGWLLVAVLAAVSIAVRAEWKVYRDDKARVEPDMMLVDVVKRIVGGDDLLVGDNCSKTGHALLAIREAAHLGKIAVWGRRDALSGKLDLYPRTLIPPGYWDEFDIDYLRFTGNYVGESKRVRGQPSQRRVENTTTTAIHVIPIPDVLYTDFWFSRHQVDAVWLPPRRRMKLQWPITSGSAA
jgi:hypothetical protein